VLIDLLSLLGSNAQFVPIPQAKPSGNINCLSRTSFSVLDFKETRTQLLELCCEAGARYLWVCMKYATHHFAASKVLMEL
jgi:hypothetical protein